MERSKTRILLKECPPDLHERIISYVGNEWKEKEYEVNQTKNSFTTAIQLVNHHKHILFLKRGNMKSKYQLTKI